VLNRLGILGIGLLASGLRLWLRVFAALRLFFGVVGVLGGVFCLDFLFEVILGLSSVLNRFGILGIGLLASAFWLLLRVFAALRLFFGVLGVLGGVFGGVFGSLIFSTFALVVALK
jgi:hypothetical protein